MYLYKSESNANRKKNSDFLLLLKKTTYTNTDSQHRHLYQNFSSNFCTLYPNVSVSEVIQYGKMYTCIYFSNTFCAHNFGYKRNRTACETRDRKNWTSSAYNSISTRSWSRNFTRPYRFSPRFILQRESEFRVEKVSFWQCVNFKIRSNELSKRFLFLFTNFTSWTHACKTFYYHLLRV